MKVCLSADMEGISHITDPFQTKAYCREYWDAGRTEMNNDVAAAAQGLLDGGASEVVVLDNHGSGNTYNLVPEALPEGAHLETWNVFDLVDNGVQAMLQVGYHPRCGPSGFIAHTYVGGLRLRANGELISESHGRTWASRVPLLGIIGNDTHAHSLGSLGGVRFLEVQRSHSRGGASPVYKSRGESSGAIREFAAESAREWERAPTPTPPEQFLFEASMPEGFASPEIMGSGGWIRRSPTEYYIELATWSDARRPLAAAMQGTSTPYRQFFQNGELRARDVFEHSDEEMLREARQAYGHWIQEEQLEWIV